MYPHLVNLFCSMEGLSVLNKDSYKRVLWHRRMMAISTCMTCIGVVLLAICAMTTSWAVVEILQENNSTIQLHMGVWGEWKIVANATHQTKLWIPYFPGPPPGIARLTDSELQHFHRTMAVFTTISLALMFASNGFALYSFIHHRYMYKRLTAGLMSLVAMCILVVIETLIFSVNNWKAISEEHNYTEEYLKGMSYGFSTYLAWITFSIYIIATVVFIFGSQKQKGRNAATQEFEVEDRPFNLGRSIL
ncbi:hypothetical protein T02_14508 [Trichinella nativa]|uniref:Uncharacterized protein n=1 Tax=Trichinella nativa TaxID=6335 RepID=A0A0V1LVC8_9BILA|nr:hypothetical protein T02_14508 [Trichinella nativa]